jgi:hypothetical protein
MSSLSLNAALRVCKVDVGYADKINSDRFLNPNNMLCPLWNGLDVAGRPVCPDSFYTKSAGCNSALDRVMVENDVFRPKYTEYITLNASGINRGNDLDSMPYNASMSRSAELRNINSNNPHFGANSTLAGNVYPRCKVLNPQNDVASMNENTRMVNSAMNAQDGYNRRSNSGF